MCSMICSWVKRLGLLAAALLVLAGCTELREIPAPAQPQAPLRPQSVSLEPSIRIDVVLYFPNQSRTKLAAEPRQLAVAQAEPAAAAVVRALLDGPQTAELRPVGTGLTFDRVEVTTEVINVYLNSDPEIHMTNTELTDGKFAVATTLIDYAGVRCVNVLIDGLQTAFQDTAAGISTPTGALTRATDLIDEFNTLEQKAGAPNPDLYTVLYFPDPAESFLLPEVRRVVYPREEDMLATLVAQLQQGPENSYNYQPVLDPTLILSSHALEENPDGTLTASLVFNRNPGLYAGAYAEGSRLAFGALAYSICDFLPRVSAVEVRSQLSPREAEVFSPADFADLLGCRVQICLPNTPDGVTMSTVERVLPQAAAADPRAVLQAVFEGPVGSDSRDVWPAVPDGVSMAGVLDVYIAGDVLVVDFSAEVADAMAQVEPQDGRTMLFAIINTLTSFENVRRVQFLVGGERRDWLGSETICILDPLMKNPGIIK